MSAISFSDADELAAIGWAREELYEFSRWMFWKRRGYLWLKAEQHQIICDALMRVFRGECKRLIINVPPRYSKTEIAVVNFIAWALGKVPDAEFIHTSYSGRLAANNAWQARELVLHEEYRRIFPDTQLRTDSSAKDEWRTTSGGCVYAVGAGGTITGYGAGKHRPGFGGCFPFWQPVETEIGPIAIGEIVSKKIGVRVWSYNETTGETELKPIDTFWTNPKNDLVRVHLSDGSSFDCTPDHKVLTDSGWVSAVELSQSLNLAEAQPGFGHSLRSGFGWVGGDCDYISAVLRLILPRWGGEVFCNTSPCLPGFYLSDNACADTVSFSNGDAWVGAGENFDNLFSGKFGARPSFKHREGSVADCILHILGFCPPRKIFKAVVSAVPVQMSSFIFRVWAETLKCFKDKVCDISQGYFPFYGKVDSEVPFSILARLEKSEWNGSTHIPRVRDFIEPKGSFDKFPVLVENIGHVDTTYCLEVRDNNNFILSQSGAIVKNCIIIDDPHKADEARSDVMRQNVLDWFQNTLESRCNSPDTPIILIMQRLHESDLSGWLLGRKPGEPPCPGGNGEIWEHVCLPALRENGSALWPEKHTAEDLRRMQEAAPYTFSGQYQQQPSPAEGGIFKPDMIGVVDAVPNERIKWVRGWDFGSTIDGDWTVGARIGRLPDGRFIIADVRRLREGPDIRDAAIKNTAAADGHSVKVSLPQDPGQAGKTQVLYLTRALGGYKVVSSPESGDKITRAEPFAAQVNVGNVLMVRGEWNEKYIDELRMFPNGTFDDQVDASSRAFGELISSRTGFFTR